MRSSVSILMLVVLLALHAPGCTGSKARKTTWRFAIEEIQGSVQDAYAQEFKRLIEDGSDGQIRVTVYPYGTLGTSDQITEQLHLGAIQFATASPGHIGKLIPELQAFLLHFVLSDDPRVNPMTLRPVNRGMTTRHAANHMRAAPRQRSRRSSMENQRPETQQEAPHRQECSRRPVPVHP